jgi:lipopolysaccharide biosynthesis regulator YciM
MGMSAIRSLLTAVGWREGNSTPPYECMECGAEFSVEYHSCPECGCYRVDRAEWCVE